MDNKICNNVVSMVNSATNFLSRGWELIVGPSKTRCEIYASQAKFAQEKMQKENISKRERKFWAYQNDQALSGLAEVHQTNSDTFIGAICAVGAGLLIGCKVLARKGE